MSRFSGREFDPNLDDPCLGIGGHVEGSISDWRESDKRAGAVHGSHPLPFFVTPPLDSIRTNPILPLTGEPGWAESLPNVRERPAEPDPGHAGEGSHSLGGSLSLPCSWESFAMNRFVRIDLPSTRILQPAGIP